MEFNMIMIVIIFFTFATIVLFSIYHFGIREKTYEEAMAEQRKRTEQLFDIKPKKIKAKKLKKNKDKTPTNQDDHTNNQTDDTANQIDDTTKKTINEHTEKNASHINFVAELALNEEKTVEKKPKEKQFKPILKENCKLIEEIPIKKKKKRNAIVEELNHFEKIHPKDEFELLKTNNTDKTVAKKTATPTPKTNNTQKTVVVKEEKKKKKKNDLDQLVQKQNGLNTLPSLLNLVRKAELSRLQVQIFIDMLLNKQQEAPLIIADWTEGKSDPVQKLKKQLAEKEKLFQDEKEATQGVRTKLSELRQEYVNAKMQLQQKIRGLEDLIKNQQTDIQRHNAHNQAQNNKMQHIQMQLNEEMMKSHQMRDEIQIQRQQFELTINQNQEFEILNNQLRNEIDKLSSHNHELRLDLQRLSEDNNNKQESFRLQLTNYQDDLEKQIELNRNLEKGRLEYERNLETCLQHGNDLENELQHLNSLYKKQADALRFFEENNRRLKEDVINLQRKLNEDEEIINRLENDLENYREEIKLYETKRNETNLLIEDTEKSKKEIIRLQTELKRKSEQQEIIEDLKERNDKLRTRNTKVMEALKLAEESRVNDKTNMKNEYETNRKAFLQRLFPDLSDDINKIPTDKFETNTIELITNYLNNIQKHTNDKQIDDIHLYYKNVIDQADKHLEKIYESIKDEENVWRTKLLEKTNELEKFKSKLKNDKDDKINELENLLKKEQNEKNRIMHEYETIRKSLGNLTQESSHNKINNSDENGVETNGTSPVQDVCVPTKNTNKKKRMKIAGV